MQRTKRTHGRSPKKGSNHGHRQGFTLIELMVVVGIITVLVGIGAVVMNAMRNQTNQRRVRMLLQGGMGMGTEYAAQTQYWVNSETSATTPFDWNNNYTKNAPGATGTGKPDDSIERFLFAVWQLPETRGFLESQQLDDLIRDSDGDGFLEFVDPWGNKCEYARRVAGPSDKRKSNLPYLASAGVDGEWGVYDGNNNPDADGVDNLYSLDIE